MYSIILQTIFHKYQNKYHKINTSFVNTPDIRPLVKKLVLIILMRKAVYNNMRLITIIEIQNLPDH